MGRCINKSLRRYVRKVFYLFPLLLCLGNIGVSAQEVVLADNDLLHVAYIYNFSKYFTWLDVDKWNESNNLNICIQNENVANGEFSPLVGKMSQGKNIQIMTLDSGDISIIDDCHIWFLDEENFSSENRQLLASQDFGVLTISDVAGFAEVDGIIEFIVEDGRIKFKINTTLATENELKASSFLLNLGIINE